MNTETLPLTDHDAVLIFAYLQGDSELKTAANQLRYNNAALIKWLCAPHIIEAIKRLKSLELDRCQITAARARTAMMLSLQSNLQTAAAAAAKSEIKEDGAPSNETLHFMKLATLLTRLTTFKPVDLKDASKITAASQASPKLTAPQSAAA